MRLLNIKTSKEQNVFFSSDFHLRHQGPRGGTPLWISRGYKNPDHMTSEIINTINRLVMPNDYLFYMGDWALNTNEKEFETDLSRIGCRNIMMLWGNHNNPIRRIYEHEVAKAVPQLNGDIKWYDENDTEHTFRDTRWYGKVEIYPLRYKNIVFCGDYMEAIVDGQYICMSHFPMDVFNQGLHGAFMLCGHSHGSYEKTRTDYKYNRRLDLSWDLHLKPLSIQEIKNIMAKKEFLAVDHHGSKL